MFRPLLFTLIMVSLPTDGAALEIGQTPKNLPAAKKGIWPKREYFLAVPDDKDVCFVWAENAKERKRGKADLAGVINGAAAVTLRLCPAGNVGELPRVAKASSRVVLKHFGVTLDKVENADSSVVAINYHVMSDTNDADLFVQQGDMIYFLPGLMQRLEKQLTKERLQPDDQMDHVYLEVRKIEGRRLKCNLAGHRSGQGGYRVDVFFWVEIKLTDAGVKLVIAGRAKPEKGERRGGTIISPYTGKAF